MSLFAFLFETIRPQANNPANKKLWLPGVLDGIHRTDGNRGPLLPLSEPSWNLGAIKGSTGYTITKGFMDNWATFLERVQHVDLQNQYPIGDPASPSPTLALGGTAGPIVINGLDNVYVEPAPAIQTNGSGYVAKLRLQLGSYDGTAGKPTLPALSLDAPYTLEQKLCLSSDNTTCNGNGSTDIVGGGLVSVAVSNAWIDATLAITIAGTGATRALAIALTSVVLTGPTPGSTPDLAITSLTVDAAVSVYLRDVWATLATQAIESPDGAASIFANMNAAFSQPSFLATLSSTISSQLAGVLDSLVGPATNGLPSDAGQAAANPADQYVYDRIRYALDAPASSWYLPRILCNLSSPRLEPLTIASIGLPPQTIMGLTFDPITLTDVVLHGLTNLETPAAQIIFSASNVTFTALLGAMASPPKLDCAGGSGIPLPPAVATSNFSMVAEGTTLTGSLTVTVANGSVIGVATADGDDALDLTINVASLRIALPDVADLHIGVQIDSAFQPMIESVLNQPGPQGSILDGLNKAIAGQLGAISAQVTSYARTAIQQQLA